MLRIAASRPAGNTKDVCPRSLLKSGGIMIRSLASVLAFLMFSTFLLAQTESGGDCDLLVRVRTNDERGIDAPIQVQVLSARGLIASANISGGEPAQFRVTNGKTYRLTVSGLGIETVTTPYFEINPLEGIHTETVRVKPANQKPTEASTPGSPTISVSEMTIPRNAGEEMNKGLDAYSKGDMENAAAHFEKALAEYPPFARAYYMLGMIAIKRSDRVKARESFSKAIQTDATFLPAYVDLARMDLQEQNYAESESLLAKVIALNPFMLSALALRASTEFANKEYDKALVDVQRTQALPQHEQFAELHIMAGKVLRMQNRPEEAIAQFQLFLREKPDSPLGASVREALASLQAGQP
jgi:tetratricopeptide (TPR) repeat protein